ncbi:MAG: DUF4416 family protein [Deltaproteobacteria bacterium]|nr:DUF4416 family protein [Deltaproteobacteria bacterium]
MGFPREPKPVKIFVALLASSEDLFASVEARLTRLFGALETASGVWAWELSGYYTKEMGRGLRRKFLSFTPLVAAEKLPEIKLAAQKIEAEYLSTSGERQGRTVNADPGYLDMGKVVLASTKPAPHRLYLREGIYGEVTLLYYNGAFHPFDYTYADYRWPQTLAYFADLRALYVNQLKRGF